MEISIGTQITSVQDKLVRLEILQLLQRMKSPKPTYVELIQQLRIIQGIDQNRYREAKKQLAYFCCALFSPAFRKKENFVSTLFFVLDLDHISADERPIEALKLHLMEDNRIFALFLSPSADGLKIVFKFSQPCIDVGLYSSFYKIFTHQFAQKYQLEKLMDYKTFDVSRACFIGYDPDLYVNENAEEIVIEHYLEPSLDFDSVHQEVKEAEQFFKEHQTPNKNQSYVTDDVLLKIKQKLNPNFKPKLDKNYFIPQEIEQIMGKMQEILASYEIELVKTEPLNYGKKITVKTDKFWAELNLFYGKKGFSIVKTTKTGSNEQLANLTHQILTENFIQQYNHE